MASAFNRLHHRAVYSCMFFHVSYSLAWKGPPLTEVGFWTLDCCCAVSDGCGDICLSAVVIYSFDGNGFLLCQLQEGSNDDKGILIEPEKLARLGYASKH